MFKILAAIISGIVLSLSDADHNAVKTVQIDEAPMTFEQFCEEITYKELDKLNPPHYNAQSLMNRMIDTTWDVEVHDAFFKSFKERYVKITGIVNGVRYNPLDGCKVTFKSARREKLLDGSGWIICYFSDPDEVERARKLQPGDKITLIGKGSKYPLCFPTFENCYLK